MTPQAVYQAALTQYRDPELAMRLACRAEGIIDAGKPPSNISLEKQAAAAGGGHSAARRTVAERNNAKVLTYAREHGTVSTAMAHEIDIRPETMKRAIQRLLMAGEIVLVEKPVNKARVYAPVTP